MSREAAPADGEPRAILRVRRLAKSFGGARALKGVDLEVRAGEVHGLLGANGSGKSTLVKVLAGFHDPDPGAELEVNGQAAALPLGPGAFRRLGLSFVHQNLGLIPSLSVLENLRMGELIAARGVAVDWRRERREAAEALTRFGVALDLDQPVETVAPVDRALLAMVRAFEELAHARAAGAAGVLVLDEPTPFLPREGVERLFALVRQATARGAGVLFISHDIDEVMTITDRVTVLRDGLVAAELDTRTTTREAVIEAIVGRALGEAPPPIAPAAAQGPLLVVRGLRGRRLRALDLTLKRGEVLGLTGLIGSGHDEPPQLLFGARRALAGTVALDGAEPIDAERITPTLAIRRGFAFVPADRAHAGGVGELKVEENLFLPSLDRFFRRGLLDRGGMRREAAALGALYDVRPNAPDLPLAALSGGNAQKVMLARWMSREPALLLLDEPTQGVDVGARAQIFDAIKAAAAKGLGVLCASSDAEQLVLLCSRVLVFARGEVVAELQGGALTREAILSACYASASPSALELSA